MGQKVVLSEELKTAQSDRTAAKKAKADKDIAAVAKAIAAIEKGMAGSFLQSSGVQLLRNLLVTKHDLLMEDDQQDMLSFLSGSQAEEYAPQSGSILGILKQMHDEMVKGAGDATESEEAAIKTYEELM